MEERCNASADALLALFNDPCCGLGYDIAMPSAKYRVLFVALAVAIASAGCDLVFPPARTLDDEIRYLPIARQTLQALERWWPLLMPTEPAGSAMGVPAFTLPLHYGEGLTADPLDWPGFAIRPSAAKCAGRICRFEWAGEREGWPWRMNAVIDAQDGVLSASEAVSTSAWGTWELAMGLAGRLETVRLTEIGFGVFAAWGIDCLEDGHCELAASQRDGVVATGRRNAGEAWTFDLLPGPWTAGAPWRGVPRRLTHGGFPWRLAVSYANGLTSERVVDLEAGSWRQVGPGDVAWTGHKDGSQWTISGEFARDQVLYRVETTATVDAQGKLTTLGEWRTDTRGRRIETRLIASRDGAVTALDWRTSGWSGRVQLRPAAPGWRVEGFLATPAGDLISFGGWRFATGMLDITFGGWRPEDPAQPFEDGDIVMLPDGSARSRLLVRQVNDTYAEFEAWSPPEGISPLSLD